MNDNQVVISTPEQLPWTNKHDNFEYAIWFKALIINFFIPIEVWQSWSDSFISLNTKWEFSILTMRNPLKINAFIDVPVSLFSIFHV